MEKINKKVGITITLKESEKNDFKEACKAIDTDMNKWVNQQAKKLVLNHKRNKECK